MFHPMPLHSSSPPSRRPRRWLAAALCCALGACATAVDSTRTPFTAADTATRQEATLARDVEVDLPSGYKRHLPGGSRWRWVGSTPQGRVYRPIDTVFTIEGRNVHEAYLVLSQGALVGFYLPGEGAFSSLSKPLPMLLGDTP